MIIYRYLTRQLFYSMVAVTSILLLIIISGRLIAYLSDAAAGELSVDVLLLGILFRVPSFLELILPLGFFMAVLLTYGRLYLESEMTVLIACGMSTARLLYYTMVPAVCVAVTVGAMSLYISPWGAKQVEQIYQKQASLTEFEMLSPGRFQSAKHGDRVTYTESLTEDKRQMNNVFIAEGNRVLIAQTGIQYVNSLTGSRYLQLQNGVRYEGVPGQKNYNMMQFETYGLKIANEPEIARSSKKESIPTLELWHSDNTQHRAQLQWRISLVLLVIIVTLIAVPLSKVSPRQGRYFRLFPAILLYLTYLALLVSVTQSIEKGDVGVFPGLWVIHILFLALGFFFIYQQPIMRVIRVSRHKRQITKQEAQ